MANKVFAVFGEQIEVLVRADQTNGSFAALTQTSPPGGGPPLHMHAHEDELFSVLEGEYEVYDGESWQKLPRGEVAFGPRHKPHTFRNCGTTDGKILIVACPAGIEDYLEEISPLSLPMDMEQLDNISRRFGIKYINPT